MGRPHFGNNAYILLLIRQGAANWESLSKHFGLGPKTVDSRSGRLLRMLHRLNAAKLIEIESPETDLPEPPVESLSFKISPLLGEIQDALHLSLAELANSNPQNRIIVSPIFHQDDAEKYGRDIFVLMPFTQSLTAVYEDHLKLVAGELKLTIARADDFFTNKEIMTEIWSAIFASKIIIADCTNRNPNVFYEIGIAHSLGKNVVLITQQGEDVPFDLRHRRYITYEVTPRGMKSFEDKLRKTILEIS